MRPVQRHYDKNTDDEWLRLERHRIEFAVTWRAMEDHLPKPPARVLDLGGGPGRYAIALHRAGYSVVLADLSRNNLDYARDRSSEAGVGLVGRIQLDARDVPVTSTAAFDVVLLLGPLYHLITPEDRLRAVREARRVLRPGGLVLAAFITRFAALRDSAQGYPEWVVEHWEEANQLLHDGVHRADETAAFTWAHFAHPNEIDPLMAAGGFQRVALIGVEGVAAGHEAALNGLTGQAWERWVDLNYRLGHDPTLYGASDHLLYIGHSRRLRGE